MDGAGNLEQGLALLRRATGDSCSRFHDGQWEAIDSLVAFRARLLIVQRTGWGKSMVYFMSTRMLRDRGAGPTLLISPLLALMRNQILSAERLGLRAVTLNSSNRSDWTDVERQLGDDEVDLLLVSPERLANDEFRDRVLKIIAGRVGLFVVDEAHSISDWGHDFRPDYKRIARILQVLPRRVPLLATTATANDRVVVDVLAALGEGVRLLRGPLVRPSLRLQVVALPGQAARLAWLAEQVPVLPGSGVIYTLTIRDAQQVALWLQHMGIEAHAYWGALDGSTRESLEQRLLDNSIKVLVATSALGMGFDKPDLGFVIHYQRPGSVVHYYQQVGRAGRAIPRAYGVLLGGSEDDDIVDYFIRTASPPEAHIGEMLAALEHAEDGLTLTQLERNTNLRRGEIEKVLKILAVSSPTPIAREGGRWFRTPVRYEIDRAQVERLIALRHHEQRRMQEYVQSKTCLMQFLSLELNDPNARPCGICSVCRGSPWLPLNFSSNLALEATQYLRHNTQIIKPRFRWPSGLEPGNGLSGSIADQHRSEEGRALCSWGDDGWGSLVRRGKQVDGRFDDALVSALVSLVQARWNPRPRPMWVTCIPSHAHPRLVPDLARRLASQLRIPFVPCVRKVRPTKPQKEMHNSYHQVLNLVGAFDVIGWRGLDGPVLLVDDMVDSGWTFTVVGALLRAAGSGPVFPLALAVTSGQGDA
jgi:ATP-dependent DNA helicase RecQ